MPSYKYVARDRSGKASSGKIDATDDAELRRILRSNELFLTHFKGGQVSSDPAVAGGGTILPKRVKLQDMVILMRQMATLVRSGIPIVDSLQTVRAQTDKPELEVALLDVERSVIEGQSLSTAMRRYPKIFNTLVLSLVEAGETAGTLEYTLDVAADQLDREAVIRMRVKQAMAYPKLVVAASCGTVAAMLILVVPVFADVYKSLHADLPAITLLLIAISAFVLKYWWMVVLGLLAIAFAFKKYRETPGGGRRIDIIALKIPVLGPVLRKIAIARFVQTLAGALKGGVPVLRSLSISANTAGNTVIRDAVTMAGAAVRDGSGIAEELEKSGEFPMMVTRMIAAGETSGNIDTMLEEVNRFYERDVEYAVDKMTKLLEPMMTVMVGSIVLFVLLALYMPIFNLGKAFQGSH